MENTQQEINETVKSNNVVLFMKGTKAAPQCGFSNKVSGILNYMGWALTSALIQWILVDKIPSAKNNTASAIIIFQIIFFASFQFWPLN